MAEYVVLTNSHPGVASSPEFPRLWVIENEDVEELGPPGSSWWNDPRPLQFYRVWKNSTRRNDWVDLIFGEHRFVAVTTRSTPEHFLDMPHAEVVFRPSLEVPHYSEPFPALKDGDGERYWLCDVPKSTPALEAVVQTDGSKLFQQLMRRGSAALRYTINESPRQAGWHLRWVAPFNLELLVVSVQLWDHWQSVGFTGVLDAYALPERDFLVKNSVRNIDAPPSFRDHP